MGRAKQPFPHYGSKVRYQEFIQPKLPETKRFIAPYGGSGTILLNREPAELEVLNDINNNIYIFFKVLQNKSDELIERLEKTPYHEKEFEEAQKILANKEGRKKVEIAHAFFVTKVMSYNAQADTFCYSTKQSRRGMSQHVSRFQGKVDALDEVAERLRRIQFMNRDAVDVITRFDKEDTLQHLDPPYPLWIREGSFYENEMTREDHREMLETVNTVNCKIAISTYQNDFYDDILSEEWNVHLDDPKGTGATNSGETKTEALYVNYEIR